jgi:hypothetical protein
MDQFYSLSKRAGLDQFEISHPVSEVIYLGFYMKNLDEFPKSFVNHSHLSNEIFNYDDEDLETWEVKAKRWARVQFILIEDEHQLCLIIFVLFCCIY